MSTSLKQWKCSRSILPLTITILDMSMAISARLLFLEHPLLDHLQCNSRCGTQYSDTLLYRCMLLRGTTLHTTRFLQSFFTLHCVCALSQTNNFMQTFSTLSHVIQFLLVFFSKYAFYSHNYAELLYKVFYTVFSRRSCNVPLFARYITQRFGTVSSSATTFVSEFIASNTKLLLLILSHIYKYILRSCNLS